MAKADRLVRSAHEHLEPGEEVLASVLGVYESEILGQDIPRNGALIATSRRLVFYGKRLGGHDLESFPYENISSFEQGRNIYGSYVHVFASGNRVEMKWIQDRRALAALLGELEARMGHPRDAASTAGQGVPDRLRELARLYEEGILTQQEFSRKKADLLREL